jgi:serine protease Do
LVRRQGSGSGVIVDPAGFIITNAHVVAGARRIQVLIPPAPELQTSRSSILKPRGRLLGAQVSGIDVETDLAVLKVAGENLPFCPLGDSDTLKQGQVVMALGSPFGLQNSVTLGVVSATARQLRDQDRMIYIQTDASINPGNSGGPLINTKGEVIGINTFILSQSGGNQGLGFAAPSNIVSYVYQQIRDYGRVRRGEIGARAQTITPLLAAGLGLAKNWGVVLSDVMPRGPAGAAGLQAGDIVLTLDGKVMENARQFDVNLYRKDLGESVILEIQRGAETLKYPVQVMERQDDPGRFIEMVTRERNLIPELGILGLDLTAPIMVLLPPLRIPTGVVVAAQAADSPAGADPFLPGDVIHFVNRQAVTDVQGLRAIMAKFKIYDPVVVQIERQGGLRYISFEIQ